ncbi:conjugal transfer protein TraG [Bacillus sp. NPDC094106]|uniref:conjugal transfer protein TraG n=1 Tax=Bacillus sp. NPDC094106 TaxID=3363949 RepID=UPI0037F3BC4C
MKNNSLLVGRDMDSNKKVFLKDESRKFNTLIVGGVGTGIPAMLHIPMLKQDMEQKKHGITVFDTKGDIAKIAYVFAKSNRRNVVYFNPYFKNVKFNPLKGEEDFVINLMKKIVRRVLICSPQFFLDLHELVLEFSIKILNKIFDNHITLQELSDFVNNANKKGEELFDVYCSLEDADKFTVMYMGKYFEKDSKTFDHNSGLRIMLSRLTSNSKVSHIFNTKEEGEFEEIDFVKHLKSREVVIFNLEGYTLDKNIARMLPQLISGVYTQACINNKRKKGKNNNNLYIKDLNIWMSGFDDFFSINRAMDVSVIADVQCLSLLKMDIPEYEHYLIANFKNFILMPCLNTHDIKAFKEYFLMDDEIPILYLLEHGEFFFYHFNDEVPGFIEKRHCKGSYLSKEENEFLNKRWKRYEKEFEKLEKGIARS